MTECAVIFDVDGPLLTLSELEEDSFFQPFADLYGLIDIPRDWQTYPIRNDVEIFREICRRHLDRSPDDDELRAIMNCYIEDLQAKLLSGQIMVKPIAGAVELVCKLARIDHVAIGIATANLRDAARLRLQRIGIWDAVQSLSGCAEDGGAKSEVLASVIKRLDLASERIVFIGDNLNDLEAARANRVHFVGFSEDPQARARLRLAGAEYVVGKHAKTAELLSLFLGSGLDAIRG